MKCSYDQVAIINNIVSDLDKTLSNADVDNVVSNADLDNVVSDVDKPLSDADFAHRVSSVTHNLEL